MGTFANGRRTKVAAWASAILIIALNVVLVVQTLGGGGVAGH